MVRTEKFTSVRCGYHLQCPRQCYLKCCTEPTTTTWTGPLSLPSNIPCIFIVHERQRNRFYRFYDRSLNWLLTPRNMQHCKFYISLSLTFLIQTDLIHEKKIFLIALTAVTAGFFNPLAAQLNCANVQRDSFLSPTANGLYGMAGRSLSGWC